MGGAGDQESGNLPPETAVKPSLLRHNSPLIQVILIGFMCFCCPGMFNALSGMGGAGGQVDPTAANNANTAIYTTFAVFGVLGGGIYNILGPKLTLVCGCSTLRPLRRLLPLLQPLSAPGLRHRRRRPSRDRRRPPVDRAGGHHDLLPAPRPKRSILPRTMDNVPTLPCFGVFFNLGGVIGGLIPFALNFHRTEARSVNDGTYIGFMVFMSIGTLLSLSILHPSRVVRDDGSRCTNIKYSSVGVEARAISLLFAPSVVGACSFLWSHQCAPLEQV
ncbi:hypothetical protein SASPL_106670 [Salvia splendens]|uniref:Uncharacterized protein n=1 Tax=Salvia splendens TaxID=180675 RepID=A0A8X8YMA1_SALSN|nr:hypothetical protein SASPL_106670 [Salvia splendens]